jgi:hypothetical protein
MASSGLLLLPLARENVGVVVHAPLDAAAASVAFKGL